MKSRNLIVVLAAAIGLGLGASAMANEATSTTAPYGYPAKGGASRVIKIGPETRHLNVRQLETVRLEYGGKTYHWTFDTLDTAAFPLSHVIPGAGNVMVYIDPLYSGG